MIINNLHEIKSKTEYLSVDDNDRVINLYVINDVNLTGDNITYPNILLHSDGEIYNPVVEEVMSLKSVTSKKTYEYNNIGLANVCEIPVFFFVYNVDNYYHFVYDTLPYLISYIKLKETIPDVKLLMNYSGNSRVFYKFVTEFLEVLGITESDIIIADINTVYTTIYISSSYTHDIDSNLPPRKEIYELYKNVVTKIKAENFIDNLPKKIYISRRTWINNDLSNIGTNYTTRRKLINEDKLVEVLSGYGYKEVFTESLNTIEKVLMFSNADVIIGSIGGGLCNVLFSNKNTKLIALISPTFLEVNNRFIYSFENVDTVYFNDTYHSESNFWKKYMRVRVDKYNIVGEIDDIYDDSLLVSYTDKKVSGWNSNMILNKKEVSKSDCVALDSGLNSSWDFNIDDLKKYLVE